jgi:ribosomal protein L16/L10AE
VSINMLPDDAIRKYLTPICMAVDMKKGKGRGSHSCTCVDDGDILFLDHHIA